MYCPSKTWWSKMIVLVNPRPRSRVKSQCRVILESLTTMNSRQVKMIRTKESQIWNKHGKPANTGPIQIRHGDRQSTSGYHPSYERGARKFQERSLTIGGGVRNIGLATRSCLLVDATDGFYPRIKGFWSRWWRSLAKKRRINFRRWYIHAWIRVETMWVWYGVFEIFENP